MLRHLPHVGISSSGDLETVREGLAPLLHVRRLTLRSAPEAPLPVCLGPPFLSLIPCLSRSPPTLLPLPSNTAHRQPPTPRTVWGQGLLLGTEGASVSLPQGATPFHGLGRLS